jgi:6-pyruvoyltetrahydropterin/6-carboxytetrahydropterin synthase
VYTITVSREFVAQHFLTVPDPEPPEGEPHSHTFTAEARLRGSELGEYDYLLNIDDLSAAMDDLVAQYRDTLLNDRPEFEGYNPSVERFAELFADRLLDRLDAPRVEEIELRMWEDDVAWASHERPA